MDDLFGFLWDLSETLVKLGTWSINFLFSNITIFGMNISVWGLVGGVGLTTLLLVRLII